MSDDFVRDFGVELRAAARRRGRRERWRPAALAAAVAAAAVVAVLVMTGGVPDRERPAVRPAPTVRPQPAAPTFHLNARQRAHALRTERAAAELLPVFARPRTAADALPAELLRQIADDGPRTDPDRSRRVPGPDPVWLLPQTNERGGLMLVKPGFAGGVSLEALQTDGFSPSFGFNFDTPPTIEGVAVDAVKEATVITADGTPVTVQAKQNFIFWQDPNRYPDGVPRDAMVRGVKWRGPDGEMHRVFFGLR